MRLRPARKSDAASLAALSIEVWISTYLRHGVSAFFAEFALSEFTTARFEALLEEGKDLLIVSENRDGIDGYIRLAEGRPAPIDGLSDLEIVTFTCSRVTTERASGQLCCRWPSTIAATKTAPKFG